MAWVRLRAKAQHFGAGGVDACGYRLLPGGVVEVPLSESRLRMKILDRSFDHGDGGALRRHSPSGVAVESRFSLIVACHHWWASSDLGS